MAHCAVSPSVHCGYIFHCRISGHVTTMLFTCLQKLNMAMPPCRRSSAAGRGKVWKGKAKARKTQVAGKGKTVHAWLFFCSATSRPSHPHFRGPPHLPPPLPLLTSWRIKPFFITLVFVFQVKILIWSLWCEACFLIFFVFFMHFRTVLPGGHANCPNLKWQEVQWDQR